MFGVLLSCPDDLVPGMGLLTLPIHKVMETGTGQTMPQMVELELELENQESKSK